MILREAFEKKRSQLVCIFVKFEEETQHFKIITLQQMIFAIFVLAEKIE